MLENLEDVLRRHYKRERLVLGISSPFKNEICERLICIVFSKLEQV